MPLRMAPWSSLSRAGLPEGLTKKYFLTRQQFALPFSHV
jgi:hypothetical protein